MTIGEKFGENLRRCRRRVGLSQEEAAVRASLHRTEIGHLESGRRVPRIDTLMKVAGAVEATPNELLEGIEWLAGQSRTGRFSLAPSSRAAYEVLED